MTAEERLRAEIRERLAYRLIAERRGFKPARPPKTVVLVSDIAELLSTLDALRRSYDERGQAIAATRPTCDSCQFSRDDAYQLGVRVCTLVNGPCDEYADCEVLGNGCYAHAPKAVTP